MYTIKVSSTSGVINDLHRLFLDKIRSVGLPDSVEFSYNDDSQLYDALLIIIDGYHNYESAESLFECAVSDSKPIFAVRQYKSSLPSKPDSKRFQNYASFIRKVTTEDKRYFCGPLTGSPSIISFNISREISRFIRAKPFYTESGQCPSQVSVKKRNILLHILEPDLDIFLTSSVFGWGAVPEETQYSYRPDLNGYFLHNLDLDDKLEFKHFVVCDFDRRNEIIECIRKYGFEVTGMEIHHKMDDGVYGSCCLGLSKLIRIFWLGIMYGAKKILTQINGIFEM